MVEIKFVIEAVVIMITLILVLIWFFPEFQAVLAQFLSWFGNAVNLLH